MLDTGAERILAFASAETALLAGGYVIEGTLEEEGIGGTSLFNVSAPYRLEFSAEGGSNQMLDDVRMLSSSRPDVGSFFGVAGMPVMEGRVTTMDYSAWSGGNIALLDTAFSGSLPTGEGHRYAIPLRPEAFPIDEEPPFSTASPLPFLHAAVEKNGTRAMGRFVLDTGAQLSILSERLAFAIGLDTDGNGSFAEEATSTVPIEGLSGTINAPVLPIDRLLVPTREDTDLVWTNLNVIVLDVHPIILQVPGRRSAL